MGEIRIFVAGWVAACVLCACAQNPVTGQSDFVLVGESQELAIGRESHDEIMTEYG